MLHQQILQCGRARIEGGDRFAQDEHGRLRLAGADETMGEIFPHVGIIPGTAPPAAGGKLCLRDLLREARELAGLFVAGKKRVRVTRESFIRIERQHAFQRLALRRAAGLGFAREGSQGPPVVRL